MFWKKKCKTDTCKLAKDIMLKEIVTVSPDDNLLAAGKRLLDQKLSGAIVLDDKGKLLGMLNKESFVLSLRYMGHQKSLSDFKVKDVITKVHDTIKPDDDLLTCIKKLVEVPNRIYRLPVVDDGKVLGVVSKSFVIGIFAQDYKGKFKVCNLMDYEPNTIPDYASFEELIEAINMSIEKKVIVMAGKKVVGIISVFDVAMAAFNAKQDSPDVFGKLKLEDVMTRNPVTVRPKDDAADAAKIMVEKRIGGLPVVGSDLEGIITKTDILKGYYAAIIGNA
ncbi:Inosine-5'-monophosphate dehydrogenase [uncultured archaeon]|nr:Inosine-5'-monophosphate dehydrogenase [uncultured archaeon]